MKTKIYFAPLEGMTTYIYRSAHSAVFPGSIDKYFAPFFMPHTKCDFNFKEEKDLAPENNRGFVLIPQILTDSAEEVLRYEKILNSMGYDEININLGCPSPTVTSKGRGSAFLGRREELDRFLDEIYAHAAGRISIKTRIGHLDPDEFPEILEIYNRYPVSELIIHPRTCKEFYGGIPHHELFRYALEHSRNPLIYNGDIWTVDGWKNLCGEMTGSENAGGSSPNGTVRGTGEAQFGVMLGRSAIANPALPREIRYSAGNSPALPREIRYSAENSPALPRESEEPPDRSGRVPQDGKITADELTRLLDMVEASYEEILSGNTPVLYRMKEMWTWMIRMFPGEEKRLKRIKKAKNMEEYRAARTDLVRLLRN